MNYVVFDIETYSPSGNDKIDTNEMRASVTGAYFSWLDEYIAFMENSTQDFLQALQLAELVVGYNHIWFDLPVLQKYASYDLKSLPNYDIMLEIEKKLGFKPRLDDIAEANLGERKTDSYETYRHYYAEKNWAPLIDYCMNDVRLTKDIFEMVLHRKPLKYNDLLDIKEVLLDTPKRGETTQSESIETLL